MNVLEETSSAAVCYERYCQEYPQQLKKMKDGFVLSGYFFHYFFL